MPRSTRKNAGQIIQRREGPIVEAEGKKSHWGASPLKDVKNEDRSGNVYENKGSSDNLPDTKDDISARLHAILHRETRILPKPSAFFTI
jgi:hypothetical protein